MTSQLDDDHLGRLLGHYRHLHQHPELSLAEHATCDYLTARFAELGYDTQRVGRTGLVATLCRGPGATVAFRADMDALPVQEETGVAWAATDGAMHACGHDIHMTCALGAAELLAAQADWSGTAEFILQPAEEIVAGARQMIADGLWELIPPAEIVFGQHVWPLAVGDIQLAPGPFFSTVDTYRVEVRGRGGHGAMPETTVDTVVLTAAIVLRLQTVVAREIGLHERAVLTVGAMRAGSKENIIPETGELLISTRSYTERVRQRLADAIARIARAEAAASGAPEPVITPMYRASSVVNEPDATARLLAEFRAGFGPDRVTVPTNPMTASEDFGYLAAAIGVPAVFWVFGGYRPERLAGGEPVPTNHSDQFLPDPAGSIRTGVTAAITALRSRLAG